MPEPALSTIKLLAAEMVEAVTVNAGAAARSAGPFALDNVKPLVPLLLLHQEELAGDDAGQEAAGVVQETWGVAAAWIKVWPSPDTAQVHAWEKQGKLTELVAPAR